MSDAEQNAQGGIEGGLQYLLVKPIGICLEDLQGNPRLISGCSLPNLKKLSALMDILWREVNQAISKNPEVSIQEVFLKSTFFQQLSIQCLELCNVSPDWVDINMLARLLFPFEFQGKVVDGILMQLNFPRSLSPSTKSESSSPGKKVTWDDMLASVWLTSKNLKDSVEVSSKLPWSELSGVMASRNEAYLSPEEKEKRETVQAFAELAASGKVSLDDMSMTDFDPKTFAEQGFRELDLE